jgi:hypothetical protein
MMAAAFRATEGAPDATGPLGDGNYCVEQGECVQSIAFARRMHWKTIWDDPRNAILKQARDPNILLPGDRLHVPDPEPKTVDAETDRRHTYVVEGIWSRVHIRMVEWAPAPEQPDNEPDGGMMEAKPRAHVPYVLVIEERSFSGTTDADGWIDHVISPGARQGKLILEPGTSRAYTLPLLLGGLDPMPAASGVCQRLANLGFGADTDLQPDSAEFQDAVQAFQTANGLEPSGVVDAETRAKLQELHCS